MVVRNTKTCKAAYTEDILCAYNKGDHIEMPCRDLEVELCVRKRTA